MTTIRILLNTPNGALHGGPATHLPMLEAALRNSVDVHSYQYWRRSDSETLKRKVFDRLVDLVRFWKLCRKVRPDIVHHNSAFDRVAILRDAPLLIAAKLLRIPVFLKLHGSHSDALMRDLELYRMCCGRWYFVMRHVSECYPVPRSASLRLPSPMSAGRFALSRTS
jgi:glycosyltransferase involved in cell wall biosynthesis